MTQMRNRDLQDQPLGSAPSHAFRLPGQAKRNHRRFRRWWSVLLLVGLIVGPNPKHAKANDDDLFAAVYIGNSIGKQLAGAINAAAELGEAKRILSADIRAARRTYWSSFRNGLPSKEAAARFGEQLWNKDYYSMSIDFPTGVGNSPEKFIGKPVDGGILPGARYEYEEWIVAMRESLGAREHGQGSRKPSLVVASPANFIKAMRACLPEYDRYRLVRDWAEYNAAGHGHEFFKSDKEFVVFLLLAWVRSSDATKSRQIALKQYARLASAVGESKLIAAAAPLRRAKKDKHGRLLPGGFKESASPYRELLHSLGLEELPPAKTETVKDNVPQITATAVLKGSKVFPLDVAIDGDTVFGCGQNLQNREQNEVAMYSGLNDKPDHSLRLPGGKLSQTFASSVAVNARYIVVGARQEGVEDPGETIGNGVYRKRAGKTKYLLAGAVFVYDRKTDKLLKKVVDKAPSRGAYFGQSVAVYGDRLVVGAPNDSRETNSHGTASVFDMRTGMQIHLKRSRSDIHANDRFGYQVAIAGDTIVVGAPGDIASRNARVYLFNATTGERLATLYPPQKLKGTFFGNSVSIEGDRVLVGAPKVSDGGAAYLFQASTGKLLAELRQPGSRSFGACVSMTQGAALIGAPTSEPKGVAYLYRVDPPQPLARLVGPSGYLKSFGAVADLSSESAVVGSSEFGQYNLGGRLYRFELDREQLGLPALTESADEKFDEPLDLATFWGRNPAEKERLTGADVPRTLKFYPAGREPLRKWYHPNRREEIEANLVAIEKRDSGGTEKGSVVISVPRKNLGRGTTRINFDQLSDADHDYVASVLNAVKAAEMSSFSKGNTATSGGPAGSGNGREREWTSADGKSLGAGILVAASEYSVLIHRADQSAEISVAPKDLSTADQEFLTEFRAVPDHVISNPGVRPTHPRNWTDRKRRNLGLHFLISRDEETVWLLDKQKRMGRILISELDASGQEYIESASTSPTKTPGPKPTGTPSPAPGNPENEWTRDWRKADGSLIAHATLLEARGPQQGTAIRTDNGIRVTIHVSQLSKADQEAYARFLILPGQNQLAASDASRQRLKYWSGSNGGNFGLNTLVGKDEDTVWLQSKSGQMNRLPIAKFSEADQQLIASVSTSGASSSQDDERARMPVKASNPGGFGTRGTGGYLPEGFDPSRSDPRQWTDRNGKELFEATLLWLQDDIAYFKRTKGIGIDRLPLVQLSASDQQIAKQQAAKIRPTKSEQ